MNYYHSQAFCIIIISVQSHDLCLQMVVDVKLNITVHLILQTLLLYASDYYTIYDD